MHFIEYLRRHNEQYLQRLSFRSEKLGFPGIRRSPGRFKSLEILAYSLVCKKIVPPIALKAIAAEYLKMWHAFFEIPIHVIRSMLRTTLLQLKMYQLRNTLYVWNTLQDRRVSAFPIKILTISILRFYYFRILFLNQLHRQKVLDERSSVHVRI